MDLSLDLAVQDGIMKLAEENLTSQVQELTTMISQSSQNGLSVS